VEPIGPVPRIVAKLGRLARRGLSLRLLPIPGLRSELDERLFQRLVVGVVAFGFAALGVIAAVAVWAVLQNQNYSARVSRTYEVSQEISEFRMLSERAETARRGLLLTGQKRFLDIYNQSTQQFDQRLARIALLTRDNPAQQKRVARLRELTQLQLSLFADAVDQVGRGDRLQAAREFGINSSPEVTFALRDMAIAMTAEENRLLAVRDAERVASARFVYIAFSIAGVIMLLVGAGSVWVILRYTRDLTRSRDQLHNLNEGLEDAVSVRTADLARANDEIQRFAYIVSHDLRSPLVNVMGFTSELQAATGPLNDLVARAKAEAPQILTVEAEEAVAVDLPEAIGFIRSSTQKMDRLINAILRLSREGRRVLTPETLDMAVLLDGIVASLRHRIDDLGAEVIIETHVPGIISDRVAVEQVLSNLIENAIKYLSPNRPGRVIVRGSAAAGRVNFDVIDNGRGIDPKDHERIFELFRRSGVQDQPGEGIGLAHVRALAYRLGGLITCDSTLDQGATFRLSLPTKIGADQD